MDTSTIEEIKQALTYLKRKAEEDPGNPLYQAQLAALFDLLHERTGDLQTLEQAIARYEEALELTPEGHPNRPRLFDGLQAALRALRERERLGGEK